MSYEEIRERTVPQVEAILAHLDKHISIKAGVPNIFGGQSVPADMPKPKDDKPPKLSEIMSFCEGFKGASR